MVTGHIVVTEQIVTCLIVAKRTDSNRSHCSNTADSGHSVVKGQTVTGHIAVKGHTITCHSLVT